MRKIITGITGIFAVVALVGASAYALFTSSVTVTGTNISTGTAGLLIDAFGDFDQDPNTPKAWRFNENGSTTLNLEGNSFVNALYPGQSDWGHIMLINESEPGVDMNVRAKISSVNENAHWNALKDLIQMRVRHYTGDGTDHDFGKSTSWMTLNEWYTQSRNLPDNPLSVGSPQEYWVEVRLPENADDSVKGRTITGLQFEITGTQVN